MGVMIQGVEPNSPACRAGISSGQVLERIDGHLIEDVLDYRFYMTSAAPALDLTLPDGSSHQLTLRKGEYEDLGLLFDTYLMDRQRHCRNRCVFCFIDQLPSGLRDSLYFKDDDDRMSFLFGNYITLTNLRERDIDRILQMRISPVNISVHTTNPPLRCRMMGNPHAGQTLEWLPRLAEGGIHLNAQLVLCPGLNDGPELERSLKDLTALAPALQSVAVVPVGLTDHREGLFPLLGFSREEAATVIDQVNRWGDEMVAAHGERICYPSDEFYLLAKRSIPPADYYGAFDQLENGVGLVSLLEEEFSDALAASQPPHLTRRVLVATGMAAFPLLSRLAALAMEQSPGLSVEVAGIVNDFFGSSITVAGLVTGGDLIRQLQSRVDGYQALLIPAVMLRHERDLFLDDVSLPQLEKALGLPVIPVENDGAELLQRLRGG